MADDSKTEAATPRKRREERKKGHVLLSDEFTKAASIFIVFFAMKLLFPFMYQMIVSYYNYINDRMAYVIDIDTQAASNYIIQAFLMVVVIAGPVLFLAMFIGIVPTLFQTRLLFTREPMKFKFSNLSPLKGIKRLFSLRALFEVLKGIIKVIVIIAIIYMKIKESFPTYRNLMLFDVQNSIIYMFDQILSIVFSIGLAYVFIALVDFLYQRWQFEKDMKMSKEDVKEEYKQTEGNPEIKSKIKQKQREISSRRMMQRVPEADVVVKNPTHFAVALKYDLGKSRAPIVIAKGKDRVALRIIGIAEENQVSVIENKPLARGLYEAVDIDMMIPEEFYQPVAEVLAWVYSVKKKDMDNL